jgi:hypothetical protein
MVAVHARGDEARGIFVGKLVEMHSRLGFQGPLDVVGVLRGVWERVDRDAGGGRLDWRNVVRELRMELNILL